VERSGTILTYFFCGGMRVMAKLVANISRLVRYAAVSGELREMFTCGVVYAVDGYVLDDYGGCVRDVVGGNSGHRVMRRRRWIFAYREVGGACYPGGYVYGEKTIV
jgi:hypothetical protein